MILENNDAVLPLPFRLAVRITIGFGHPQAPALVDGHRHGLMKIRFRRDEFGLKPRLKLHARDDFLRSRVGNRGGLRGIVAEARQNRTRGESREIVYPRNTLEGRITVAAENADVGCTEAGRLHEANENAQRHAGEK